MWWWDGAAGTELFDLAYATVPLVIFPAGGGRGKEGRRKVIGISLRAALVRLRERDITFGRQCRKNTRTHKQSSSLRNRILLPSTRKQEHQLQIIPCAWVQYFLDKLASLVKN